jgi:hypothetical protein
VSRHWQPQIQWYLVTIGAYMSPDVARVTLLEAILDATPSSTGGDNGMAQGVTIGVSRGIFGGIGRK